MSNTPNTLEPSKTLEEQIKEVHKQIADASKKYAGDPSKENLDALTKLAGENARLENQQNGKKEAPRDEKLETPLGEYTKKETSEKSYGEIRSAVIRDLIEQAMSRSWSKDAMNKNAWSEELMAYLKKHLWDKEWAQDLGPAKEEISTAKQDTERRRLLFRKRKRSPREWFNQMRISNVYEKIEKLKKSDGYPKKAIEYFMAMKKYWASRKIISPIKKAIAWTKIGALFGLSMEKFKEEMKEFLDRFTPQSGDTDTVKETKKEIYNMASEVVDDYLKEVNDANKVKKLA